MSLLLKKILLTYFREKIIKTPIYIEKQIMWSPVTMSDYKNAFNDKVLVTQA